MSCPIMALICSRCLHVQANFSHAVGTKTLFKPCRKKRCPRSSELLMYSVYANIVNSSKIIIYSLIRRFQLTGTNAKSISFKICAAWTPRCLVTTTNKAARKLQTKWRSLMTWWPYESQLAPASVERLYEYSVYETALRRGSIDNTAFYHQRCDVVGGTAATQMSQVCNKAREA